MVEQLLPGGTRVDVFQQIYWAFILLGTAVGVVVISYMLYNAYKYRDGNGKADEKADEPELGEIPRGGGKGRKLFLSFGLSAIIVVSLIIWTYAMLLYVEEGAAASQQDEDSFVVEVEGYQFGWGFTYPNGYNEQGTMRVPADTRVVVSVTSSDVFHNFGIPEQRVKSDAIPGESTRSWFEAEETGTYEIVCYELCGAGHSYMNAELIVMEQSEFRDWYGSTGNETDGAGGSSAMSQPAAVAPAPTAP